MLESEAKQYSEEIQAVSDRFEKRVAAIFAQERIDLDQAKRDCAEECLAVAKRYVPPDRFPNFLDDLIDAGAEMQRAIPRK